MKVEIRKETDESSIVRFWIYINDQPKDCYSFEQDARARFDSIKGEKKTEVLETKEV